MFNLAYSFDLEITGRRKIIELGIAKKKKQVLDDLLASKSISQLTYDYLEKELTRGVTDLEADLKSITDKMTARAKELEEQIGALELSFAKLEIHRAAEEVEDETYKKQNQIIVSRLKAAKQELDAVKKSLLEIVSETIETSMLETKEDEKPAENLKAEESQKEDASIRESVETPKPSQEETTERIVTENVKNEVPLASSEADQLSTETKANSE